MQTHDNRDHELQEIRSASPEEETEVETRRTIMVMDQHDRHDAAAGGEEEEALIGRSIRHGHIEDADEAVNRRTVRKLDFILLPFLAVLFLLNSLDKSNIGNAETAGFTHDTGLSRQDVNTSMGIFFLVFVLLQPIGAGLGRRFGMRRYVPVCMSLWGLGTMLHIWVRRRWHLIVLRVCIAMLESGFYPTTVSYMSLFYTKFEFAVRLGMFYGMTAVSGVLGGVLSWAVFSHGDGLADPSPPPPVSPAEAADMDGWKSWETLFLIEGCMTMAIALLGFVWLPKSADTAWFLNVSERAWAEQRMRLSTEKSEDSKESNDASPATMIRPRQDASSHARTSSDEPEENSSAAHDRLLDEHNIDQSLGKPDHGPLGQPVTADSGLTRQDILSAIFNYKIWYLLIINILSALPATSFGVILPILVKELSPSLRLSPAASNLLSAPPFACGAIVLFAFTIWSDRTRTRLVPILWGLGLLLVGLMMAILSPIENYWLRYASLCVLLSGSFIASPLTVAWLANNTPAPGKRAILLGINGWGNLAGVFVAVLFTPADEKKGYIRPFTILLVCVMISFVGFVAFRTFLIRENRFRQQVVRSWSQGEREREEIAGDIVVPQHFGQRVATAVGMLALAKRLGLEEQREGDEKLTYQYSL